ncbi:MAG: type I restriction-modification system endonuclease, partial [bacterium]|nr:type I restriction-modification system endonuclease [bacterium]
PFVAPQPPEDPAATFESQVAELKSQLERLRDQATEARERAALEEELRRAAETEARVAAGDLEAAFALAEESEREKERFAARLAELEAEAREAPAQELQRVVDRSFEASQKLDLDEAETRKLIDLQLREAGWEADTETLTWGNGARPQKGRNLAVAEWPTASGPADYVLFRGLVPLAVVEAKRRLKQAAGAIEQAKRYSRGYRSGDGDVLPGGPWDEYKIPFLFATNGRPFLRQIREQSGIWFLDARRRTNHPRALAGWKTPDGLHAELRRDAGDADRELAETSTDYLPLRPYQHQAVRAVEEAVAEGRREILVAMATGTGKTRTSIGLVYRLIKHHRFRRVLFVVDRTALGDQATDAFKDVRLESLRSFVDIYDVKELGDLRPEPGTRLQVATIQSLVKRLLYTAEDQLPLPVDSYDCLVIDECHRGYTLDREMSDAELEFRSEADYISKYRRVIDHFDAVKIGLTATPALHTTEIFGSPVVHYSYRRAVIDGFLVDHEPPFRIVTHLARGGIHWEVGEEVAVYDHGRGQLELFHTPDEIDLEIEDFNKRVVTEHFNEAVCEELAERIDPSLPGKTLVFCVDDAHAELVVRLLKQAFSEQYGELDDEAVMKITGAADRPRQLIRRFRNERLPAVAVTVDLLTTGIDVPEIVNLVFLRRVRSRILYEQMLGRATRLCPDLFGPGEDKEVFSIYDAVDLYAALRDHTEMKPVVQDASVTFAQLVDDLVRAVDAEYRGYLKDQLTAKLRRKRRRIEEELADEVRTAAGMEAGELFAELGRMSPPEAVELFASHPGLAELLDRRLPGAGRRVLVSEHEDTVELVDRGYGDDARRPEDYLESFRRYLDEHRNELPALVVVTQRPRELTRQQLKELKLALDEAGYNEVGLRTAWRDMTNHDIAASIIGFIRQQALGSALLPYAERVAAALRRILAGRSWTPPQRRWLERIGKQLRQETVVDRAALDRGQFGAMGGFNRINKVFDGHLEEVLGDLHEEVWKDAA